MFPRRAGGASALFHVCTTFTHYSFDFKILLAAHNIQNYVVQELNVQDTLQWYFIQESGQLQAKSPPDWSAMEDRTRMDSVCHLCEKAFTQAENLKRHLHLHTGEKSHKCGTCEKTFTRAESLLAMFLGTQANSKDTVVQEKGSNPQNYF